MRSILASIMQSAAQWAQPPSGQKQGDLIDKENRAAWTKRTQEYIDSGDYNSAVAMMKVAPSGVDLNMYKTQLENPSMQSQFSGAMGQMLTKLFSGQGAQTQVSGTPSVATPGTPGEPTPQPATGADIFNPPTSSAPSAPGDPDKTLNMLAADRSNFTPGMLQDIAMRGALKKYTGVDVGAHYFEAPSWFEHYGKLIQGGMPIEQAVSQTATQFGFIPDGASNLKGLPEVDRKIIFEQEFSRIINDPILDAAIKQSAPSNTNVNKYKAGFALDYLSKQGRYIPEHYQAMLDRFRGLDDPTAIDKETERWIWENYRTRLQDVTPDILAKARKEMDDYNFWRAQQQSYYTSTGTTQAQHEAEISTPIKAEDRAKHGIGTRVKTYAELADAGKRFATDAERKLYNEWIATRDLILNMERELFDTQANGKPGSNGIFTGIGNPMTARIGARAGLLKDKAFGNTRGRNYEYYNDTLASAARRLIAAAGETGGRYTDRDIIQIMLGAPDTGRGVAGLPDSQELAKKKFDRFVVEITRRIHEMEATTTIQPMGQPSGQSPNNAQAGEITLKDGTIIENQATYDEMMSTPKGQATIKAHGGLVAPASNTPQDADAAAAELIKKYSKGAR